jgi:hypothetical protein
MKPAFDADDEKLVTSSGLRASAGFRGRDRLLPRAEVKDLKQREAQARLSRRPSFGDVEGAGGGQASSKPSKQNPFHRIRSDRMGDGGMRPGYNVQIAVDIQSRAR